MTWESSNTTFIMLLYAIASNAIDSMPSDKYANTLHVTKWCCYILKNNRECYLSFQTATLDVGWCVIRMHHRNLIPYTSLYALISELQFSHEVLHHWKCVSSHKFGDAGCIFWLPLGWMQINNFNFDHVQIIYTHMIPSKVVSLTLHSMVLE